MNNLEIFDKNGNQLQVADVIYRFIKDTADKYKKDIEYIYLGVEIGCSKDKPVRICTVESVDNGYDAIALHSFGDEFEVNCI